MIHEKERCHMENVGNAFEGDTSYKKKTSNQLRRVIKGRKKGGELCIINILVVGLERRHTQKMARDVLGSEGGHEDKGAKGIIMILMFTACVLFRW